MPRKKKLRGAHNVEASSKGAWSKLRETRLDNQIARVGLCAVCGEAPVKRGEVEPPPMSYREFLCFRYLVCDSHKQVDAYVDLNGKVKLFETPLHSSVAGE